MKRQKTKPIQKDIIITDERRLDITARSIAINITILILGFTLISIPRFVPAFLLLDSCHWIQNLFVSSMFGLSMNQIVDPFRFTIVFSIMILLWFISHRANVWFGRCLFIFLCSLPLLVCGAFSLYIWFKIPDLWG